MGTGWDMFEYLIEETRKMNTDNDQVQIFQGDDRLFRWRRVDKANGKIVSVCGEGFILKEWTLESAEALNPGTEIRDLTIEEEVVHDVDE